ncbi:hypothetical protein GZH47_23335 [Paenibacillus rhizovicinus]|uniref:SLH domain-containing protein n=1 Tax=Paenibacillus rhizovicinus TaxID=2704463 RepID=A0A6C0P4I4_9BACL|nr:sugar-binding protein [Paenibacillus rhizovicinus]QHW33438.1 hypothetical protein GZH47_23335 [Paenibacillus rhizovicinus]
MRRKTLRKVTGVISCAAILLSYGYTPRIASASAPEVYDAVISAQDQQTVKGWGINGGDDYSYWGGAITSAEHKAEFNAVFGGVNNNGDPDPGLGITIDRVPVNIMLGDGAGNLNVKYMDEKCQLIQALAAKNLPYEMSVWSPPVGMKTLPIAGDKDGNGGVVTLRVDKEDTYAKYIVNMMKYIQSKGLPLPQFFAIQNEPWTMADYDAAYYTPQQYQRVVKKVRAALDATQGTATDVSAVTLLGPEDGYFSSTQFLGEDFSDLAKDPELDHAIGAFSTHSYDWGGTDIMSWVRATDKYPEKDKLMTEYCPIDLGDGEANDPLEMAVYTMQRFSNDMSAMKNNYWMYWDGTGGGTNFSNVNALTDHGTDDSGLTVGTPGKDYVRKSPLYYILQKVFTNVPAGSKVRTVTSNDPALTVAESNQKNVEDKVAFVNGDKTVVVLTNPTNTARLTNVSGLTGTSAKVYQTSTKDTDKPMNLAQQKNIANGKISMVSLAPFSVTVVVTSDADTAAPTVTFDQPGSSDAMDATHAVRDEQYELSGHLDEAGTIELSVNGSSVAVDQHDTDFSATVTLSPGMNTISTTATDQLGNTETVQNALALRYDPDYIGISLDQTDGYTNNADYTVSGFINASDGIVTINDDPVSVSPDAYAFQSTVTLHDGENTFTVNAADGKGHDAAPAILHVNLDQAAPDITVTSATTASRLVYVLKGSVSETAAVTINGSSVTVNPDQTFSQVVPVVEGPNTITVTATDRAGNVTTKAITIDCTPAKDGVIASGLAESPKTSTAPDVDGILDPNEGWVINNQVGKMISGMSDNDTTFGTMWDDDNLYVGVKVLDGSLQRNAAHDVWQDDSVEVYLDGSNSKAATYDKNDHQLTFGYSDSELGVGAGIAKKTAQSAIDGGYEMEFQIPWSSVGITKPAAGTSIGFDIGNNDNDNGGSGRDSVLMWNGTGDNYKDASKFGTLYLGNGAKTAVAEGPQAFITVDGNLNEPSWALNNAVSNPAAGHSDNAVTFGALSDDANLYVGVDVKDSNLQSNDGVELYLPDATGAIHQVAAGYDNQTLPSGGDLTGIQYHQFKTADGYSVELEIPWSDLDLTPTRDWSIPVEIVNNDDDGAGSAARLRWNGSDSALTDAASFGNLVLHGISIKEQTDTPTVEVPADLKDFTDEAADLTMVNDKSSHIEAINQTYFEGDHAAKFIQTTDGLKTPTEYVTYKSPEGDIYSFTINIGLFGDFASQSNFQVLGSVDGVNYQPIVFINSPDAQGVDAQGRPFWSSNLTPLVENLKVRYLKIVFPSPTTVINEQEGINHDQAYIGGVSFQYAPKPANIHTFIDNADDFTKLYDFTGKEVDDNGDLVLDGEGHPVGGLSNTIFFGGWEGADATDDAGNVTAIGDHDSGRFNPSANTTDASTYAVYKSPDGDITSFNVATTINDSAADKNKSQFTFYGSTDGQTYEPISVITTNVADYKSNHHYYTNTSVAMPSGIEYLKVVYPYPAQNWGIFLNQVAFDYVSAVTVPAVTGISPASGPVTGGTSVTISGTGFTGATGVMFGANEATSYTVNSDTSITATSPVGSGKVDVTVTTPAGTSAAVTGDSFTYLSNDDGSEITLPAVTGISPASGPVTGGTSVTISGTGFTGATGVMFGANAATSYTVNSDTSITANSPAGSGKVDVTVTTPAGTSATVTGDSFTYLSNDDGSEITLPAVTGISPASGPVTGGTSVTISGTGFTGATGVMFGTKAAASYTVNSDTSITAISPAGSGKVDVTITTPAGTSAAVAGDSFTYLPIDNGNTNNTGGGTPPANGGSSGSNDASNGNVIVTDKPALDSSTGTASVQITAAAVAGAFEKAAANGDGVKTVEVQVPKSDGAKAYQLTMPASLLTAGDSAQAINIKTDIATVTVPENMLTAEAPADAQNVSLIIAAGDKSTLAADIQAQIGDKPVIELRLLLDGKQTAWRNDSAPVTVGIPYAPTAEELKDPEHITIWYIDNSGKAVSIPSGKYDAATGMVTFSTTHFSEYAVVFVNKTFADIGNYGWAKKQIEVLASKGVINGTSAQTFSPAARITRADYLVLLVRTLGLSADFTDNFVDVNPEAYFYKEIGIAKKLGIATGVGDNSFNPEASISRQEMMTLTEKALRSLNQISQHGSAADLNKFADGSQVAAYAADSVAALLKEGLIEGDGDLIKPQANTTRAEAAVFLYRIYNLK